MRAIGRVALSVTAAVGLFAGGAGASWWWFEERDALSAQERRECEKARDWVDDWVEPRSSRSFYEDIGADEWELQGQVVEQMNTIIDMRWKLCHP